MRWGIEEPEIHVRILDPAFENLSRCEIGGKVSTEG